MWLLPTHIPLHCFLSGHGCKQLILSPSPSPAGRQWGVFLSLCGSAGLPWFVVCPLTCAGGNSSAHSQQPVVVVSCTNTRGGMRMRMNTVLSFSLIPIFSLTSSSLPLFLSLSPSPPSPPPPSSPLSLSPSLPLPPTDLDTARLKRAQALGADHTIQVTKQDSQQLAKMITEQLGCQPDQTIECSGAASSIATAIYVSGHTAWFVTCSSCVMRQWRKCLLMV